MEKQGLNELAAAVHENAVAHGWWEQERELPEILMLCVSELAEALEEYRAGKPNIYYNVEGEEILYADGEACEKHERRRGLRCDNLSGRRITARCGSIRRSPHYGGR